MGVVIQRAHAQARTGVGQRQLLLLHIWQRHATLEFFKQRRQIGADGTYIGKLPLQRGDVVAGAFELVGLLADGHIDAQQLHAASGAQRGHHRRIDAAGNADGVTARAGTVGVVFEPA